MNAQPGDPPDPAGPSLDVVPPATPATADLICWLWAAFPAREGVLHTSRIANDLGVSSSTVRRWIADAQDRRFDEATQRALVRRAILRGRGTYLWPDLDEESRQRQRAASEYATRVNSTIRSGRGPAKWATDGTLDEHLVAVVHFPRAHVYGVSSARTPQAMRRLQRYGEIVHSLAVPNKYAAIMLKQTTLGRVDPYRCVAPRELVPTGRTETWREAGGRLQLRRTRDMRTR